MKMSCSLTRTCLKTLKLGQHAHRTSRLLACCALRKFSTEVEAPTVSPSLSSPPPVPVPETVEVLEPDDKRYDPLSISFRIKKSKKKRKLKENELKQLFPNAVSYDLPKAHGLWPVTNYGKITFSSASKAKEVIQNMNGKILENGAVLQVQKALRPSEEWLTLDQIEIPKKIERSPTAILEALSATVGKDYTSSFYYFVDDPWCYPKSRMSRTIMTEALQSGKDAAHFIIKKYKENFEFNDTHPRIEAFDPQLDELELAETSQLALLECIKKKKVEDAINMHKNCMERDIEVSEDTNLRLLDLLTLYNSENSQSKETPKDVVLNNYPDRLGHPHYTKAGWRKEGYAEKLFMIMTEKNQLSPRAYNMMLKGRAKYGDRQRAMELYNTMKQTNIPVEIEAYNLMVYVAFNYPRNYQVEKVMDILRDMKTQGVVPNQGTFNTYLKALLDYMTLKKDNPTADMLKTLKEMKICGVEPSLATWYYVYKIGTGSTSFVKKSKMFCLDLARQIIDSMEGKIYTPTAPEDYLLYHYLAQEVRNFLDVDVTYKLHKSLHTGNNYRFLNTFKKELLYHLNYMDVVKLFEPIDTVVKKNNEMTPVVIPPSASSFLQYLDMNLTTDAGYKNLPLLWQDMIYCKITTMTLVEFYLSFMSRKKHYPELEEKIVEIARDLYQELTKKEESRKYFGVSLKGAIIDHLIMIFVNADLINEAWEVATVVSRHLFTLAIKEKDFNKAMICLQYLSNAGDFGKDVFQSLKKEVLSTTFIPSITASQRERIESLSESNKKRKKKVNFWN
ncbi:hypothetical protein KUTeg_004995 [Tegillarca granosa]|uniref:Small ribosomal subunit protein mS39 n=1 Tax=Tegillarca granosa TaxID=220873 RepID=A0ABQ9FIH5_TEGGR|nr:hypothetical protein KUTeg_004995 [Tegillarca granosa]